MLLVDLLIARLTVPTTPPSSATPFSLYGCRHKWLDGLPPFDSPSPQAPQVLLQDLMQLQALISDSSKQQSHMISPGDHMTTVATHLEQCLVKGMVGEISLKLLAWPYTGKMEQVHVVNCMHIV